MVRLTSLLTTIGLALAPAVSASVGRAPSAVIVPPGAAIPDEEAHAEILAIVHASLESSPFDAVHFGRGLDLVRDRSPRTLFELCGAGGIPAGWSETGSFLALEGERLDEVRRSLARMAPAALRGFLLEVAQTEPRVSFREVGVDLVGTFGEGGDLRLLARLGAPLQGGNEVLPRFLRTTFEKALLAVLERDRRSYAVLASLFEEIHVGLRSSIVNVLQRIRKPEALEALASMLGRSHETDALLLTAIARLAPYVNRPISAPVVGRVRAMLDSSDEVLVRTAMRACGLLEDYDAVPRILSYLGRDGSDLSRTAHRALREMTELGLQYEQHSWERWYELELVWYEEHRPAEVDALRRGDAPAAIRAVSAIARHRIERHQLAEDLLVALDRPEPEVALLACRGLAKLGSEVAVQALIDCLSHGGEEVRNGAWEALRAITGQDLPPDPDRWRAAT